VIAPRLAAPPPRHRSGRSARPQWTASPDARGVPSPEGFVIQDLRTGARLVIHPSGADLWRALERGEPLDAVAQRLDDRRGLGFARARAEVDTLLARMVEAGLVRRIEPIDEPAARPMALG
jgi:hypothetical protein